MRITEDQKEQLVKDVDDQLTRIECLQYAGKFWPFRDRLDVADMGPEGVREYLDEREKPPLFERQMAVMVALGEEATKTRRALENAEKREEPELNFQKVTDLLESCRIYSERSDSTVDPKIAPLTNAQGRNYGLLKETVDWSREHAAMAGVEITQGATKALQKIEMIQGYMFNPEMRAGREAFERDYAKEVAEEMGYSAPTMRM